MITSQSRSLSYAHITQICGGVWWLPATSLPETKLFNKIDAVLNGFGNLVVLILCLAVTAGVVWVLYAALRVFAGCLLCTLDKIKGWFVNVDDSITTLKSQQTSHSNAISWLERKNRSHEERFNAIEKLLADLEVHTAYEIKEMVDCIAKEFTGEER